MSTTKLQGKVAIVTGGSGGIGRATCQLFAEHGASVVVVDVNVPSMEDTIKSLSQRNGNKHCAVACDITKAEEIDQLIRKVEDTYKNHCTILINIAGINGPAALIDEIKEVDFDKNIDVNLKGTMLMARGFIKALKNSENQTGGVIVNMSSLNGKMAVSGSGSYCASKFGVVGITKTIAAEFPTNKVRCNAILPGFVDTPMFHGLDKERVSDIVKTIPLERIAKPEEIASVCLFLASDDSSYVNGATLDVSGGLFA